MIVESPEFWESENSLDVFEWFSENKCPVYDAHGDSVMKLVLQAVWLRNPGSKIISKKFSVYASKKKMNEKPWAAVLDHFDADINKGWVCTSVAEAEQVLVPLLEEKPPNSIATYGDNMLDMFPGLIAWVVARELNNET
jgi:hypothetical protein